MDPVKQLEQLIDEVTLLTDNVRIALSILGPFDVAFERKEDFLHWVSAKSRYEIDRHPALGHALRGSVHVIAHKKK